MYKLLIADDEPLVQVGIRSMLDWKTLNIEICGIASNGQTAFSMIENTMPDIVITDIKMPIMSGLELAKKCRECYEDNAPAFIILTSYEDFSYAKEAVSCQVADYLVKIDLTPELLLGSVKKILQKLEKENRKKITVPSSLNYIHDNFFIRLLHNLHINREQFQIQAKELKIDFSYKGYVCCYCELFSSMAMNLNSEQLLSQLHIAFQMARELFSKYHPCHTLMLDLKHFALIFCYDDELSDWKSEILHILSAVSASLNNYYSVSLHTGIGILANDPMGISESYQYSRDAFSNTTSEKAFVLFDDCTAQDNYKKSFNISVFKASLVRAYEEQDADLLEQTLQQIITLFHSHPGNHLQAMDCASNILYLSISLLPDGEELVSSFFSEHPDGYCSLYKMTSTHQIIDWLSHFCSCLTGHFRLQRSESRKPIVFQVKNYIRDHITEHLSLSEVAEIFNISPNYLSQLFKKYNDMGYNDYVTQCKIDEARKLLKTGDYKIYEIAELLGFESAFYFSKVFKKVVGVPPTEYRD